MSFVSVMKAIGKDIEKVFLSPWFQTGIKIGESVIGLAVPALGPAFNLTVQAVLTAEANFAAVGQSTGTGQQKLASVISASGNLIGQALKDAGVNAVDQNKVSQYISAIVTILNSTPSSSVEANSVPPPATS